jgi:hypothetical protein
MKKGEIVYRYFNSGAFGEQQIFGEVVRVNRKSVTVRWEGGNVWRIESHHLYLVTGKLVEQVRSEYLSEPSNNACTRRGAGAAISSSNLGVAPRG